MQLKQYWQRKNRRLGYVLCFFFGAYVPLAGMFAACVFVSPALKSDSDVLVEYHRSGGFVGLDDRLVILRTGEATLSIEDQAMSLTLTNAQLSQIEEQLTQSGFTKLASDYLLDRMGADQIEYVLIYGGHQVRGLDTTMPETLYPTLDLLDEIITQAVE